MGEARSESNPALTTEVLRRRLAEMAGGCGGGAGDGASGGAGLVPAVSLGLGAIDAVLPHGGLPRRGVHEWIGVFDGVEGEEGEREDHRAARRRGWSPPLAILLHVAWAAGAWVNEAEHRGTRTIWIGESVWPYAPVVLRGMRGRALRATPPLLSARQHLFVRAERGERVWAMDLALRSRAAAVVIADGSGLDLTATRRLQLAAESGGALCLLARPPWEERSLSAAATRWRVRTSVSDNCNRRWTVELLRCKGLQPAPAAPRRWTLEHDRATRAVAVVPDVFDGPGLSPDLPAHFRFMGVRRSA